MAIIFRAESESEGPRAQKPQITKNLRFYRKLLINRPEWISGPLWWHAFFHVGGPKALQEDTLIRMFQIDERLLGAALPDVHGRVEPKASLLFQTSMAGKTTFLEHGFDMLLITLERV